MSEREKEAIKKKNNSKEIISGVVGLDLSLTCTGVARIQNIHSMVTHTIKTKSETPMCERYVNIIEHIIHILRSNDVVFIEDYAYGVAPKKSRLATLGELCGIVKYVVYRYQGRWSIPVASTTIKKWFSGNGKLAQDDFKMASYKKYGIEFGTKDEVVAHALADFGYSVLGLPLSRVLSKTERKMIDVFRAKHQDILQALAEKFELSIYK